MNAPLTVPAPPSPLFIVLNRSHLRRYRHVIRQARNWELANAEKEGEEGEEEARLTLRQRKFRKAGTHRPVESMIREELEGLERSRLVQELSFFWPLEEG